MKTITLTDEAYERIAALKTSPKDSFSKVILRCVPKRGTAAQLLAGVSQLRKRSINPTYLFRAVSA